ncbi:hypothetical protein EW026_g3892 [Hermanssonia centrifuga]|uniref:Zn(2)-C6 fungal-type domain-containing protein n=1 Tax=Hermanssonia centrifuga TaxID=98765 RepID=A0A4S4KIU1_9APHY|nr:hypothetical protein EW026_g3892 [Hermanssonia centrifuga]
MSRPAHAHLERGKACLRCRGRKMRCDGAKPSCGQCTHAGVNDCEYDDAGPTASQILERRVAQLQARIRELEEGQPSGTITLHRPHSPPQLQPRLPSPSSPDFLRSFSSCGFDFGFFLHMQRFKENMKASIPPSDDSPIPSALVYVVLLIDALFSNDPAYHATEDRLLALVQQNFSSDFHPTRMMYTLQTEVLLSYYLFHKDRRVEGGYHAAAAVSIVVACGLHKLGSTRAQGRTGINLPLPRDAVEDGERINAFWTVIVLDRCWTVWMQTPSVLIDETSANTQIDTPWPLDMIGYEQGMMPAGGQPVQTVQAFLNNPATDTQHQSLLALRAKASILYEKSAQIAAHWNPNAPGFQDHFVALDNRINQFKGVLPSLRQAAQTRPDLVRGLLTVHILINCATMQLHAPWIQPGNPINRKSLTAARTAVTSLQKVNISQLGYIDPFMGILLGAVGRSLATALRAVQRNAGAGPSNGSPADAAAVQESYSTVLTAMQIFSAACPLIGALLICIVYSLAIDIGHHADTELAKFR